MRKLKIASIFVFNKILDIIYPPICLMCGKNDEKYLCNQCEKQIKKIELLKIEKYENKYFNNHLHIFKYEGIIRNKIIDYKFNNKPYINELFVKIILKNEKICRFLKSYDIIIPVPIHKNRKRQRGYNQSELIVRNLVNKLKNKNIDIQVITDILIKTKNNNPQNKLNKEQRIENVKNVYTIQNQEKIFNKNIIIFDDIYTTGNTANECARILKTANCKNILIFTIAKD